MHAYNTFALDDRVDRLRLFDWRTNSKIEAEHKLTGRLLLKEFQRVGRGFPSTTSQSASTWRSSYLTSTDGNSKPTLQKSIES